MYKIIREGKQKTKKLISIITIKLLLVNVLTLAFNIQTVRAKTIIVPDEFPTIQAAIYNASAGDIIFVRNGTYHEHLVVTRSVSIVGENMDTTIVDGDGTGSVILVGVSNVNITNFTLRNAGRTWRPPLGSGYPDCCILGRGVANILIKNNTFNGAAVCVAFTDYSSLVNVSNNIVFNATYIGVLGYSSSNITVDNNFVYDYGSEGIHLDGGCSHCKIINNTVKNGFDGISLEKTATAENLIEGNNLLDNNASIGIYGSGSNVFRRNNMTGRQYNLLIWGYDLTSFMQDIDDSNVINNKPVYYLTNRHDLLIDPISYPNLGYVALVNCTNTVLRDFNLTSNGDGLLLACSINCTLINMTINGNWGPLVYGGLTFFESNNNTIVNSEICNNSYGICLYHSDWNSFYHNSFICIDKQVVPDFLSPFQNVSSGYFSSNIWDNGYPAGGNFWSSYTSVDLYRGLHQNEPASDGIGDTSYIISENNIDNYPLMKTYAGPHDIGLKTFISKTIIPFNYNITVTTSVTIINYGEHIEDFNFTFQSPTTTEEQEITLETRNSITLIFEWNTTNFVKGTYTISACANPVDGETDTSDNNFTNNEISVTIAGDVTSTVSNVPDGVVDMLDIEELCNNFGTTPTHPHWNPNLDINDDTKVNMRDIGVGCNNFGKNDP